MAKNLPKERRSNHTAPVPGSAFGYWTEAARPCLGNRREDFLERLDDFRGFSVDTFVEK